jgi:hypothetical protein
VSDAHWPTGGPRKTSSFVSHAIAALGAKGTSNLRSDDAHPVFTHFKSLSQLVPHCEGAPVTTPDGQVLIIPRGDGGAGLHGGIGYVGHEVLALQYMVGLVESRRWGTFLSDDNKLSSPLLQEALEVRV